MLFSCERSSAKISAADFTRIDTGKSEAKKSGEGSFQDRRNRSCVKRKHDAEGPSGAEDRAHVNEAGDFTAGEIPVPIPNTEVKPRRADCTARESVWESRSSPT